MNNFEGIKKKERSRAIKKWFAQFKNPFVIVVFIIFVVYSVTLIFALYWGFSTSLKSRSDFVLNKFGLPNELYVSNYILAWKRLYVQLSNMKRVYLPRLFLNSFIYSFGLAFVQTFSTAMCAYVCNKYKNKFTSFMYSVVIFMTVIPIVTSLGANIRYSRLTFTYDNILMIFYQNIGFYTGNFLVSYATFATLSWSYAESAFIDGAGNWSVMLKIMFPLVKVPLLILFVLSFIGHWNDYFNPLIYLPSMPTAAVGLFKFQDSTLTSVSSVPVQMAASMLVCLPCLILFLILKDKMIGNLTMGGLKG